MVTKSAIAKVKGIVPIYKESGVNCYTLLQWIRLHIAYEFPTDKNWYIPYTETYRAMEPYASGVLTVGIGRPSFYVKYLKFCDSRYTIDLRMGQSTITDYYLSPPIERKSFDHIKLADLQSACQSFIGSQVQMLPKVNFIRPIGITDDEDEDDKVHEQNEFSKNFLSLDNQMRYSISERILHRRVTCHSIDITRFDPPDITLEVNCGITFSLRSFAKDLFNKLDTCGSFVNIKRTQEGPFTLDQCIDRTDLYLKYLGPALKVSTEPFIDHVRPHLDKLSFYDDNRLNKTR